MQEQATAWQDIIAAKKEAVGLQLEGEYRSRLAAAHAAVKKRLDYQVPPHGLLLRFNFLFLLYSFSSSFFSSS